MAIMSLQFLKKMPGEKFIGKVELVYLTGNIMKPSFPTTVF